MGRILQVLVQAIGDILGSGKARGKTIDHPLFGQLTHDGVGLWEGTVALGEFGDEVALTVAADRGEPPSDAQGRAFEALVADLDGVRRAVEQANLSFYTEVILGDRREEELRERPDERPLIMREMPDVDDASLLWKWLTDPGLHVPKQEEGSWVVELAWNCQWDEEHGHEVTIRNGKVETW